MLHCIGYLRNDIPHNVNQSVLKSQVKVCLGELFWCHGKTEKNQIAHISSKRVIGPSSSVLQSLIGPLYILHKTVMTVLHKIVYGYKRLNSLPSNIISPAGALNLSNLKHCS